MGKKDPPKEPDYTKERAAFAQSSAVGRQNQANVYNSQVDAYNAGLQNMLSQYDTLSGQIGNLTIRDKDQISAFQNSLNALKSQAAGSSFNVTAPDFSSMVQSPYGAVQVDAPQLHSVNSTALNTLNSGAQSLLSQLSTLQQQRQAEEARIRDFNTGLLQNIAGLNSSLSSAGIGNKSVLDNLRSQLDSIDTQRNTFSSSILDQLMPTGFSQVSQQEALARATLDDLFGRRAAEQDRINQYNTGLQSNYDNFLNQFNGLTIANADGMTALKSAIDAAQLGAGRFSSELSYNFSPTLNDIQSLEDRLDALSGKRTSELARIDQAKAQARAGLNSLDAQLGSADIYNLSTLKSLEAAIRSAQGDIANFKSDLPFDFSEYSGALTEDQATLQQLLDRRTQQLGGFQTKLDDLSGGVASTDLWNEDAFKKAILDLQGLQSQTGRFTGNDVSGLNFGVQDAISAAQGRLGELTDYRNDFEKRAQDVLAQVQGQSFYNNSDFTSYDTQLAAMQAEMDKYKATQGADELAGIKSRLDSERSRLAQDLTNSATPSALAQSDVARMLAQQTATGPMTAEQYLAFLQSLDDEEQGQALYGNFARNLGIIRL